MEISKINSNNSFGMAWNKAAKPFLVEAVSSLSKKKQPMAIEIINRLEQNSPHHTIEVFPNSGFFAIKALRPEVAESRADFVSGKKQTGFLSALKKIDKFIASENAALPERQPVFSELFNTLAYITKRDVMESGVRMFDDSMPSVISSWTRGMTKKGRSVDSVLKQIKRIDSVAKRNELKVYIKKDEVAVYTKTMENLFGFKDMDVKLEHLDFIEDSMNVYVNMRRARATLIDVADNVKTKAGEKKLSAQLASLGIIKKLQSTKLYKFFASIKQKHVDKVKEKAMQKEKAVQEAAKKIAENIKI